MRSFILYYRRCDVLWYGTPVGQAGTSQLLTAVNTKKIRLDKKNLFWSLRFVWVSVKKKKKMGDLTVCRHQSDCLKNVWNPVKLTGPLLFHFLSSDARWRNLKAGFVQFWDSLKLSLFDYCWSRYKSFFYHPALCQLRFVLFSYRTTNGRMRRKQRT